MDGFFLPFSQLFNLSSLFGTLVSSLIFLVVLFLVLRRRRPVEQRTKESAFDQTVDLFPQDGEPQGNLPAEIMAFLSSIKVLEYVEEPIFMELVKYTESYHVTKGQSLFLRGHLDKSMYVVTRGTVRIMSKDDASPEPYALNEVGPGGSIVSLFNILAVMTGHAPLQLGVTAVAEETVDVIRVPLEAFAKLAADKPSAVHNIVQVIMTRFQRVTFLTLHTYFGLTTELLTIEENVNRLPSALPPFVPSSSSATQPASTPSSSSTAAPSTPSAAPTIVVPKTPTIGSADGKAHDESGGGDAELKAYCAARFAEILCGDSKAVATTLETALAPPLEKAPLTPSSAEGASPSPHGHQHGHHQPHLPSALVPIEAVEIIRISEGSTLVDHGVRSPGMHFVISGELEVSMRELSGLNRRLMAVGAGGVTGFLAILSSYRSFTLVKAKADSVVGYLSRTWFEQITDRHPSLWISLSRHVIPGLSPLVTQIDLALDWVHVNAGKILYRENDDSDAVYVVLHGRLRAILQSNEQGHPQIKGEYVQGSSVGDLEVLTDVPYAATVHAVRDTELGKIPKVLFYALARRYPQVTIQISRLIARRSVERLTSSSSSAFPMSSSMSSSSSSSSLSSGKNMSPPRASHIRTIAVLPSTADVPLDAFCHELHLALSVIGPSSLLSSAAILEHLGKHAFHRVGKLKLMSWLEEQETNHRTVVYQADQLGSPWLKRSIRQADLILIVANANADGSLGEYERALVDSLKTTARKELVLLHADSSHRTIPSGTTIRFLNKRPWIHLHHHVLAAHMKKSSNLRSRVTASTDVSRVARSITGHSVGVVLGGGGARGFAHLGILTALNEAGIPIDLMGGTSMGAFIAGLYARNIDLVASKGLTGKFCSLMTSRWRQFLDLTYPFASWFTGKEFNTVLQRCLGEHQQIEDNWLNTFCIVTNITQSRMDVMRTGHLWRYTRASMSLSGFMPPICDRGDMLLDGGYINNLPADVMLNTMSCNRVIAVDVGSADDRAPMDYGDSLSGWWLLWNYITRKPFRAPSIADIQSKLAYVSCVKQLEEVKNMSGILYLQPPVAHFETLAFAQNKEIIQAGLQYGREIIEQWRREGVFSEFLSTPSLEEPSSGSGGNSPLSPVQLPTPRIGARRMSMF